MHGSRGKADKRAASNLAHLLLLRDGLPSAPKTRCSGGERSSSTLMGRSGCLS